MKVDAVISSIKLAEEKAVFGDGDSDDTVKGGGWYIVELENGLAMCFRCNERSAQNPHWSHRTEETELQ